MESEHFTVLPHIGKIEIISVTNPSGSTLHKDLEGHFQGKKKFIGTEGTPHDGTAKRPYIGLFKKAEAVESSFIYPLLEKKAGVPEDLQRKFRAIFIASTAVSQKQPVSLVLSEEIASHVHGFLQNPQDGLDLLAEHEEAITGVINEAKLPRGNEFLEKVKENLRSAMPKPKSPTGGFLSNLFSGFLPKRKEQAVETPSAEPEAPLIPPEEMGEILKIMREGSPLKEFKPSSKPVKKQEKEKNGEKKGPEISSDADEEKDEVLKIMRGERPLKEVKPSSAPVKRQEKEEKGEKKETDSKDAVSPALKALRSLRNRSDNKK